MSNNTNINIITDTISDVATNNPKPYCPYCDKLMMYDEVYPYQRTTYKCDCENWKKQEDIWRQIRVLRRNIDELLKELDNMKKNNKAYKEIQKAQQELNRVKGHYCDTSGYKWNGKI